nr:alpha-2-macroglobulin [Anaerolineae bacterium]
STAIPIIHLVDAANQELIDQGKGGGGGGREGYFDVRSEFEDTAYWSAVVRTGSDGLETVTVTLPDNLTTWRMDARAVTADTLVAQQTVDIVATKPLLIRPVTPRFFVVADEATLSAVVQNNTDAAIEATVTLDARGVVMTSSSITQQVTVPAGGRVSVEWDVTVSYEADWVDLVFMVEGGGLSDASRPPLGDPNHEQMLPVYRYEVPETVGTAGQLTEAGTRVEGIVLPPTYDIQAGSLDIQIDPSLASSTLASLDWLKHFPYECTEQVVSRFLPNALTLRAFREFNLTSRDMENNLQEQMQIGIQRLYAQQHADGGWGWFVASQSDSLVTAYVVQGLLAAQQADYPVEQRVLDDAIRYLQNQLDVLAPMSASYVLDRQVYILYVLAQAGVPDVSLTVQFYDARQNVQHYSRALLAQALYLIEPDDPRLDNIKSDLVNSAIISATGVHWEEEYADRFHWNTDTRSTAIILDTFARLWPDSELAPNIVRWLMTARNGSHWETTQETAWALIGLTDWMIASGELSGDYAWSVEFNGQPAASGQVTASNVTQATHIAYTVDQFLDDAVNRLVIERGEGNGQLYYTAHLTAYLPVEEVPALNRGIVISRRYLDAEGNPVTGGAVGDTLTVEVSVITARDLYYLVVEDPLPAGAEAVDTNLLTESQLSERPTLELDDPLRWGWGWWWFSEVDLRDEKAVLYADFLPSGTYVFSYQIRLGIPGTYRVIPSTAREFYFPEVYGRGEGLLFEIEP